MCPWQVVEKEHGNTQFNIDETPRKVPLQLRLAVLSQCALWMQRSLHVPVPQIFKLCQHYISKHNEAP